MAEMQNTVRVDWRVWCLLELKLFYHTIKGLKDTSFQESILNFSVLRRDTRLWLDCWQYSALLQTDSWLGTGADDMMAVGASIADGQGLACWAWQAPDASGIVLLYILNHSWFFTECCKMVLHRSERKTWLLEAWIKHVDLSPTLFKCMQVYKLRGRSVISDPATVQDSTRRRHILNIIEEPTQMHFSGSSNWF